MCWFQPGGFDGCFQLSQKKTGSGGFKKHQIFEEDNVPCEIQTLTAPNLTIGIVEAAWRIKPNFVILIPGRQDALGKAGLRDLKTRLGEMGHCMIVLLRSEYVRPEPCKAADSPEVGRVIHARCG